MSWLDAVPDPLRDLLAEAASGATAPAMAFLNLALASGDPDGLATAIARAKMAAAAHGADPGVTAQLATLGELAAPDGPGWAMIRRILDAVRHDLDATSIDAIAGMFDRAALLSPEASVALYSLGEPERLAAATAEVVDRLADWDLLGPDRDALDLGCGIGRFAAVLAPRLRSVTGIDVSEQMVREAWARTAGLANVTIRRTAGRDLGDFCDAAFDLVLAADSFPYLVQVGLAEAHVAEAARVLRPGGDLVILNYSYRNDPDADRAELARAAAGSGLVVRREGTHDFRLWDAPSFVLSKAQVT